MDDQGQLPPPPPLDADLYPLPEMLPPPPDLPLPVLSEIQSEEGLEIDSVPVEAPPALPDDLQAQILSSGRPPPREHQGKSKDYRVMPSGLQKEIKTKEDNRLELLVKKEADAAAPTVPICELCCKEPSVIFCAADEACLCLKCDTFVHEANAIAAKHTRVSVSERTAKRKKKRINPETGKEETREERAIRKKKEEKKRELRKHHDVKAGHGSLCYLSEETHAPQGSTRKREKEKDKDKKERSDSDVGMASPLVRHRRHASTGEGGGLKKVGSFLPRDIFLAGKGEVPITNELANRVREPIVPPFPMPIRSSPTKSLPVEPVKEPDNIPKLPHSISDPFEVAAALHRVEDKVIIVDKSAETGGGPESPSGRLLSALIRNKPMPSPDIPNGHRRAGSRGPIVAHVPSFGAASWPPLPPDGSQGRTVDALGTLDISSPPNEGLPELPEGVGQTPARQRTPAEERRNPWLSVLHDKVVPISLKAAFDTLRGGSFFVRKIPKKKPAVRFLWYDRSEKQICWAEKIPDVLELKEIVDPILREKSAQKRKKEGQFLDLTEMNRVVKGFVSTEARAAKKKKADDDELKKSFSIVTMDATYDWAARDERQCDIWVYGLGLLINQTKLKVFGVPLPLALRRGPAELQPDVPAILYDTIVFINEMEAFLEPGIFRLSGNSNEIDKLKDAYDTGAFFPIRAFTNDVNSSIGCFKQFLREMPEPLLTFALFEPLKDAHNKFKSGGARPRKLVEKEEDFVDDSGDLSGVGDSDIAYVEEVAELLKSLPDAHKPSLCLLFKLMYKVSAFQRRNKMTSHNMAIVIGPNIFRPKSESAIEAASNSTIVPECIARMTDYHELLLPSSLLQAEQSNGAVL